MSILQINDVQYTYQSKYQKVQALRGLTMSFEPGKLYALVGRSGSGKTTLLSLMAGLDLPTGGEIDFEGKPLSGLDRDLYRRDDVAVIYQSYNLLPLLTVEENVAFPLELKKLPREEIRKTAQEKLRLVGLDEGYFKRLPAMLSGGEQQRVAVARALAAQARVILADEPTGNLDTDNASKVIELLRTLAHEQGVCVIVVTHDLSIADRADAVFRLKDGQLDETPAEA
ncbi:MAG: ABC transporter ATP-binding protein [Clostridia bacterium]|nr:ABC transporter ATP-binding protein [Clostridia bacterium]MDD7672596.1 ABC transporter ATP-binding protein [Clostridia bacterium]MDY2929452.1 ABC transporter ATP-binding protein [Clostridiaceae bacterium]